MTTTPTTPTAAPATTAAAPAKRRLIERVRGWPRAFQAQLDGVEDGAAMALVRIGVGLSLLLLVVPFVATDAGREIVRFAFCDDDFGGYRNIVGTPGLLFFGGPRPEVLNGLLVAATIAAALMVVGLGGRLPILVAAIATNIALGQNNDVSGGGDALLGNALFLCLLADCTNTLSLDCRLRLGRFVDATPVPAWPRKMALVQLAVVYTVTGLQKLVSTAWTPFDGFSALYQILQSPQWARSPGLIEAADGWAVVPAAIMSVMTIVWEVFFFMVLFKKRLRPIFAIAGVAIHIGILLMMEVGIFSWLSMALYPTMFPGGCARLAAWLGGQRSAPEGGNEDLEGSVGVADGLPQENGPAQLIGE